MAKESEVSLHFRELAAMLLAAVQLHVGYTSGGCSLPLVWRFLTQRKSKTRGRKLLETLDLMGKTRHVPQGVHMAIVTITNAIETISGDRELGSIWSTAIRPLILYNSPYVAASTETSTLDLRDLQHGPEPVSLYLLAPSPAAVKRLYPVYRVIIDVALTRLMEREGQGKPEDYAHRLLLCGDEWPAYGYVPTVDAEVSTMAGYGIKGWFIAQDIPQFEETYGVDSALWGNTHCKIFHAPDNDTTAERISRHFLGEGTVEYGVLSQGKGGNSMTPHRVSRLLMTTDEVQMLVPHLGIGHISGKGLRPFLFEKVGFDPHYKEDRTIVAYARQRVWQPELPGATHHALARSTRATVRQRTRDDGNSRDGRSSTVARTAAEVAGLGARRAVGGAGRWGQVRHGRRVGDSARYLPDPVASLGHWPGDYLVYHGARRVGGGKV
jgi:type IV secretory pathway TraG/TraD family ATPase VirD4